jgi:hypothetical protein
LGRNLVPAPATGMIAFICLNPLSIPKSPA